MFGHRWSSELIDWNTRWPVESAFGLRSHSVGSFKVAWDRESADLPQQARPAMAIVHKAFMEKVKQSGLGQDLVAEGLRDGDKERFDHSFELRSTLKH